MANKASALHILVDDEKQANDILAQLNNGANFQELAKKFSNCPSKR
ncbi:peptidylprolyl isomerase, partial [Yersinia rochesterensis]